MINLHWITKNILLIPSCIVMLSGWVSLPATAKTPLSPPNWAVGSNHKANTTHDPATRVILGKLDIRLEKTTLEEVRTAIGTGEVKEQGDASESLTWLCYTVSSPTMQRLWLSSGELNGGTVIDGVSAMQIDASSLATTECPILPMKFWPIRLLSGIWIGSTEQAIRQSLGDQDRKSTIWTYNYSGHDGKYDVTGTLSIHIQSGKATAVDITHSTSN